MTESLDFVPATIQESAFTRTVDGKAVVMTPGPLKGNAKATAGSAPAVTEHSATSLCYNVLHSILRYFIARHAIISPCLVQLADILLNNETVRVRRHPGWLKA